MEPLIVEWAGERRHLALTYGGLLDIEAGCGKTGIGEIYLRLVKHEYSARYVFNVIKHGLIGGGMKPADAAMLMEDRFSTVPLVQSVEIALDLMILVMAGIEGDSDGKGDPSKPYDVGEIFSSFAKLGIPPESVRAMTYVDFVAMCRAFAGNGVQAPTEEEFEEMLRKYSNG